MSARDALFKYSSRHLKELERDQGPRRKNEKPELLVQRAIMTWLKANGWDCHVIQAKATYSFEAGRYLAGQAERGTPDICGVAPLNGLAAYIEVKSAGRRSSLKPHQADYLISKINMGAFAICADSPECVEAAWKEFSHRRQMDPQLAKAFLLRHLPNVKSDDQSDSLFNLNEGSER